MTSPTFPMFGLSLGTSPQISVPPGDPDALASASRVYAAAAEQAGQLAARVRATGQSVVGADWFGVAALSYLSTSDDAASWLDNANSALSLGASALATYAIELRQAQDTARAAQASAAELDSAASTLQTQVAHDPMQSLGFPSPHTTQAADLISQGRAKAAAMGAEADRMAQAAATKAAGAFSHAAGMTMAGRVAAAQAAARAQAKKQSSHSMWDVVGLVGLGIADVGLTAVNVAQLGLDPVTDGAEAGTVTATAGVAGDVIGGSAAVDAAAAAGDSALTDVATEEVTAQAASKPDWLVNLQRGNQLNADQAPVYEARGGFNEVYVDKPPNLVTDSSRYYRVDSYVPNEEIVSRKATEFGEVTESTGKSYVRELYDKYPPGRTIADVPSAPDGLAGARLRGDMILEVPVQTTPVPQSVLDLARELDITIRDVNGTVYGP